MQIQTPPGWTRFVLFLAGLATLAFGIVLALDPVMWLSRAGVSVAADAVTRIEIGAFYGGLEIGLGLLLLSAASQRQSARPGLWLLLASHGGIGLTRLALMLAGGIYTGFLIGSVAYELTFALLAAIGLRSRPRSRSRL